MEYVPPVEVKVICKRSSIPLDENEGIYVLNTTTGRIRAVIGNSYMLNHEEELWAKPLPLAVQRMLAGGKDPLADRSSYQHQTATPENPLPQLDLTRVVSFRVPHNAAVRIYDYSRKLARIIFGPDLVMLGPDEHFTILSLSGGKPKQPGMISSICLLLGPDFCTDVIVVETADHARLSLQLSYNWGFMADRSSSVEHAAKLFSVPDFVGDMCKAVASRIRGNVASVSFDDFHKVGGSSIHSA
ncbi:unnamed protein product [Protopolystoma xenopodis]|uniref:Uncharacterized protein n=1 Tax=Protopolystoma xenopodis TaxID=117903 RepID=A0A448X1H4_9PLAT|nr:unnamed protein product [Protopolystoma xenopodis]